MGQKKLYLEAKLSRRMLKLATTIDKHFVKLFRASQEGRLAKEQYNLLYLNCYHLLSEFKDALDCAWIMFDSVKCERKISFKHLKKEFKEKKRLYNFRSDLAGLAFEQAAIFDNLATVVTTLSMERVLDEELSNEFYRTWAKKINQLQTLKETLGQVVQNVS
ncbi:MAG: hypothetical protein KKB70_10485 [Proteobacteria bacterium]|nr:hypothetical protein [Pseudomonadota bacterium]